ncbi:MAG: hypothetical protein ACK52I_27145 [Pseudomonadota bacterium]|jgi:hypothetical protein
MTSRPGWLSLLLAIALAMPLGAAAQTNPVLVGTVIDAARCGASSLE